MGVSYLGTWERGYPRNEQVIAALRMSGVTVALVHEPLWTDEHKFALGPRVSARLLAAEAKLALRRVPRESEALLVGYPGQFDVFSAKRHGRPVVFNAMVSLYDTFVDDRRRFAEGSLSARALHAIDRAALRGAAAVVADTKANARYLAELADIEEPAVCYVGAEEDLFRHAWRQPKEFVVLFVGKLIPLHGLEVILGAASRLPDVRFRIVGSGQLESLLRDRTANVEHVPWIPYAELPDAYANAGCALGVFGTSAKARRVIPNKAFQALAVGTPLITAVSEGVCELLQDGRDALLPDASAQALADAILRLRDDPARAERTGAGGLRTSERDASAAALGERWRSVLESVTWGRQRRT